MTFFAQLTRRRLLKMVGGLIGGFVISQHTWFLWKPGSAYHAPEEILWSYVQRILVHPESAMVIGKKYLQCRSCEADVGELTKLIVPHDQPSILQSKGGLSQFRKDIRKRIREDFLKDQTIILDGWILSLTEVRLCSLMAVKMDSSIAVG